MDDIRDVILTIHRSRIIDSILECIEMEFDKDLQKKCHPEHVMKMALNILQFTLDSIKETLEHPEAGNDMLVDFVVKSSLHKLCDIERWYRENKIDAANEPLIH